MNVIEIHLGKYYNRIDKQKKNEVSNVDLELKEFEEKINNITEQFMSLLDSNDVIESSITNTFETNPSIFNDSTTDAPNIFNNQSANYMTGGSNYKLGTDTIKFGGIGYGQENTYGNDEVPKHAVKFDSVEQMDLNNQLEKLYNEKRSATHIIGDKPSIAFSDSNLNNINSLGRDLYYNDCTKVQTDSTLNNKEVYDMSNYCEEPKNENVFYNFATIPEDRALVEKRDWKDILFMDIPWDTKIDIWGGIKKFCSIQVKFTA